MDDSGEIALIDEIAQLVGRFEREFASLAGRDVAEHEDRAAALLPLSHKEDAPRTPPRNGRSAGARDAPDTRCALDRFTAQSASYGQLLGRQDMSVVSESQTLMALHRARFRQRQAAPGQIAGGLGVYEDDLLAGVESEQRRPGWRSTPHAGASVL